MEVKKMQCPICKEEKKEFDFVSLKDGMICNDCAEKLVVAYPVSYYRNPNYQISEGYERDNGGYLISVRSKLVETMVDNGQPRLLPHFDGIENLSLAEYPQKLASLEGVEIQLRHKYDAESVFQVQGGFPLLKVSPMQIGIFEAKKLKNAYLYYGRGIVGTFTKKDAVTLIHDGKEYKARILGAYTDRYGNFTELERWINHKEKEEAEYITSSWRDELKRSRMKAGYLGYIILEKETPMPMEGDMILKH